MKKTLFILIFMFNISFLIGEENTFELKIYHDLDRFKKEYKSDSILISKLMEFNIGDTIDIHSIWYDENDLDSNWIYRSHGIIFPKNFASLKLNAYYWVILIIKEIEYSRNSICLFYDKKNKIISDYEVQDHRYQEYCKYLDSTRRGLASYKFEKQWELKTTLYSESIKNYENVRELENKFNNWFKLFKRYGLEYLRENEIYPISDEEYKILNVHWL